MTDTNTSAAESSCDEKHEKWKRRGKWNEENVTALLDLLEERPCLWNIFDSQYKNKVKKTKSSQATNKLYQPLWIHWERLQFLANQIQSGGTRDTIDINASAELKNEVSEAENNIQPKAKLKHKKSKCLEEKKMEILEGYSKMLASSVS